MDDLSKKDLSVYRIRMAEEHLRASKILLDNELYKDSIGRSYYAMFSVTRALLALDGRVYGKRKSLI